MELATDIYEFSVLNASDIIVSNTSRYKIIHSKIGNSNVFEPIFH